ncbi:MAG TPA: NAD(P)/FAD-dependent oxidoreductase, partial [Burkholderiaceae bacterium]|nr:NAD(P)/FAD-dependent oxidoreductase [Burkholderiaceae bacterium]
GYLFHFPFLPDELRLQTHNCLYPDNLYKGVFFQNNPKLIYLGMQDQYFTFNMFDAQAWYARDVILGKIQLPDPQARLNDMQHWLSLHDTLETPNDSIDFQAAYVRDLIDATDYPDFPIEKQAELLKSWLNDKKQDIMGFRNKSYRSTITGTQAADLPRPWLDIKDDSLEGFMAMQFEVLEEVS